MGRKLTGDDRRRSEWNPPSLMPAILPFRHNELILECVTKYTALREAVHENNRVQNRKACPQFREASRWLDSWNMPLHQVCIIYTEQSGMLSCVDFPLEIHPEKIYAEYLA